MAKLEVQTLPDKPVEKKDEVPYFFPRAAFVTIPPVNDISTIVNNYDNPEVFDSKPKRHDLAPDSISLINRIPSTDLAKEAVRVSLHAHTGLDGNAPPPPKEEAEALFKAYEEVHKDFSTLFSSKKIYADELALELYPIAVILLWQGVWKDVKENEKESSRCLQEDAKTTMVNILKKLRDQLVEGAFSDTACALKSILLFRAFASFMASSVVYFTDPADEEGSTKLAGEFSSYMWYDYFSYIMDDYEMYDHVFEYHYLFCIERNFILAKYLADTNFFNPWLSPYASAKAFFEYVMKYIFGYPGENK